MKKLLTGVCLSVMAVAASAQLTLEHCLAAAEANYPLIERYGIVERFTSLSLSDINRAWLPKISIYAQGTVQNDIPEFPSALSNVMQQMGHTVKGLDRWQYKGGVDLQQTIWDGGASKHQRAVERASGGVERASLDVRLYAVRQAVEQLYFGILLMDEQVAQSRQTADVLQANLSRLRAMYANGTAMQSDVDMVEAQLLTLQQGITEGSSAAESYRRVLDVFTGESSIGKTLDLPEAIMPTDMTAARPELSLYELQAALNDARNKLADVALLPKIGFFAQAWYGYPGLNYFESMMNRKPNLNLLAGLRISWNVDAFYTRKNRKSKTELANASVKNERELFLFNNSREAIAQASAVEGLKKVMADDERIIELRSNVRKAAESQLQNGIIDATALLTKITDESRAKLQAKYHQIQLTQKIYQLKYTLNR